jgi:hypothetical protein
MAGSSYILLDSIPGQVKPKTIKLEFAASPMRLQ